MKKCPTCKKSRTNFVNGQCRECYAKFFSEYYTEYLFQSVIVEVFNFKGCMGCGETDLRVIQFDHNFTKKHTPIGELSGQRLYLWMLKHPIEAKKWYSTLCSNCNWRKRWENREFGVKSFKSLNT